MPSPFERSWQLPGPGNSFVFDATASSQVTSDRSMAPPGPGSSQVLGEMEMGPPIFKLSHASSDLCSSGQGEAKGFVLSRAQNLDAYPDDQLGITGEPPRPANTSESPRPVNAFPITQRRTSPIPGLQTPASNTGMRSYSCAPVLNYQQTSASDSAFSPPWPYIMRSIEQDEASPQSSVAGDVLHESFGLPVRAHPVCRQSVIGRGTEVGKDDMANTATQACLRNTASQRSEEYEAPRRLSAVSGGVANSFTADSCEVTQRQDTQVKFRCMRCQIAFLEEKLGTLRDQVADSESELRLLLGAVGLSDT
ncbi:hypothetical protein Ptr902_05352 [Pyrenophora tritici-repentis]|nr:hypothetical protein Ptr902_05352 [Pyrenophora tritici-repentis]